MVFWCVKMRRQLGRSFPSLILPKEGRIALEVFALIPPHPYISSFILQFHYTTIGLLFFYVVFNTCRFFPLYFFACVKICKKVRPQVFFRGFFYLHIFRYLFSLTVLLLNVLIYLCLQMLIQMPPLSVKIWMRQLVQFSNEWIICSKIKVIISKGINKL